MRKKLYFAFLVTISTVIYSCDNSNNPENLQESQDPETLIEAEGGKFYGGILKVNSIDKYTSLFPATITDVYSQHISSQIFEGLLKYNQNTLEIEPCIAETYEINAANKIYTFNLRKGVFFHDDECFENGKGREVVAEDFKFVFEFLCSNNELNKSQYLVRDYIKGGSDYAKGKTKNVEGIKIINSHTLQIELEEPFSGFTNVLALSQTGAFPREAYEKYGADIKNKAIGSGPYKVDSISNDNIVLIKNNSYWKKDEFGNQLPFIAQINISFDGNKSNELASFNKEELDFVWGVPVEEIPNIMGTLDEAKEGKNREFELQSINSLQVQYFGFNLTNEAFKDIKVRQAFNYAINKDSIVNYTLQGEGIPSNHGIIPQMKGYNNEKIKGYKYDPVLAKSLLREAGYSNGKGFPKIKLYYNKAGQINELLANEIRNQILSNLNIDIELIVTDNQQINQDREDGKLDFWRYGWIADFPDPSNFISHFHSKYIIEGEESSINYSRYNNIEFDKYLELGLSETNEKKRKGYYLKAEQILISDAAVIPLYYASEIRLINPPLKNFPINEIEFRDYSVSYFIEKKENKKIRVYDNLEEE
jgi:oligopeptide transport system substrate-binding protein